jgi:Retrotransposon gag protein
MRNVLIGALKGNACEWLGSLHPRDCDKRNYFSIEEAIKSRYGKTYMQKIRAYEAIKQKAGETLQAYADRLRKATYGINKTHEEVLLKFYSTMHNSAAIFDDVINLPCETLQKAVEYVE